MIVTLMSYTLGEASKATGKSKPTISRAIKSGRISATRQPDGSFEIDESELHRVFPKVFPPAPRDSDDSGTEKQAKPIYETGVLHREIDVLRERLQDKDGVIEDLRRRLDAEAEERRRLTAVLTDQRPGGRATNSWWRRLWGSSP